MARAYDLASKENEQNKPNEKKKKKTMVKPGNKHNIFVDDFIFNFRKFIVGVMSLLALSHWCLALLFSLPLRIKSTSKRIKLNSFRWFLSPTVRVHPKWSESNSKKDALSDTKATRKIIPIHTFWKLFAHSSDPFAFDLTGGKKEEPSGCGISVA